jgi:3-(3-hydroxy-phenyl)propionate hydroxylase
MSSNLRIGESTVLIAGGGPVGCSLSIALSNLGVDNVVVERDTHVHPLPRAVLIDGELVRALIQLGLGDRLTGLLTPMRRAEYVDADGTVLASTDLTTSRVFGGLDRASLHFQPQLEAMLRDEMLARGGRFLAGTEFIGVDTDASDEVSLLLADGGRLTGRYLVGCDGASSTVRRSQGIVWDDLGFNQDWLVVDIEVDDRATCGLPDVGRQVCDPVRPTTMISGHDRYYRWEFQLQPGEDPQEMNRPERVWQLLAPWIDPQRARLVRSAPYCFHAVVAATMRRGRVLLAGDAAHQMPPFQGQGLNSGMRDAVNLAWKLRWVLEGWSGDGLLDTYSSERREHAKALVEQSVETGRLIDQYAGRVSHGIAPRDSYSGDRPPTRYTEGVVWGTHPRVGLPFGAWDQVADGVPTGPAITIVSSSELLVPHPASGRPWRTATLDRAAMFGADHVVVRPDGWVAAVCDAAELPQALADLDARLAG